MAWFKVDDKLHSHKKAVRAGVAAMGLWTVAGSWCADQLTDGFVPDYIALRLAPDAEDLAAQLVAAGLWVEAEHDGDRGWRFHAWEEYQPTREQVESQRERERDKKRNQRRNRAGRFEASPTPSRDESPPPSPDVSPGDTGGDGLGESDRPDPTRPVPEKDLLSAVADPEVPDETRDLTRTFAVAVKANGFKVPKRHQKAYADWLTDMDRLRRLGPPGGDPDPQDPDEIRRVIQFATSDPFWKANIGSPAKFREQYPKLRLRMLNGATADRGIGTGGVA